MAGSGQLVHHGILVLIKPVFNQNRCIYVLMLNRNCCVVLVIKETCSKVMDELGRFPYFFAKVTPFWDLGPFRP